MPVLSENLLKAIKLMRENSVGPEGKNA